MEEPLLNGHLGVTRELLQLQTAEKKFQVGSQDGGSNLITVRACLQVITYMIDVS